MQESHRILVGPCRYDDVVLAASFECVQYVAGLVSLSFLPSK